ncbi:MAG: DUF1501 domain-containing protein, partial [Planctomycetales bacterium]|nr:DUF1501 domain-containing protein [Planctomycetales bacterium]
MFRAFSTRREFLSHNALGVGGLALAWLLQQEGAVAKPASTSTEPASFDMTPKQPHFAPHATAMISMFMHGGPSHVDLLDP